MRELQEGRTGGNDEKGGYGEMAKAKGVVAGNAAEMKPVQCWKVSVDGRTATVVAENKLSASHKAACKLGVV